ncbi:MORN repeat-containing protein 5 [Clydaea vesicula]|uniref:MORN repeat-containing protein 5 n=1 Tax=Clydaea vesicula TaxID=447962 RepID=A0AAD5TY74_9FUNG|nr:MORN repeat-containing protein 5 [Clydaea vesicula]
MAFYGSPFLAEQKNERIEGKGKYTFPSGNIYVGEFKDGKFHGKGIIHFKTGGQYEAEWINGIAQEGQYTFKDGLIYEAENWDYCTKEDRRFFAERVNGFSAGIKKF